MRKKDINIEEKISKAMSMNESAKLRSDFDNEIWDKLGVPNPSFVSRIKRILLVNKRIIPVGAAAMAFVLFMTFAMDLTEKDSIETAKVTMAVKDIEKTSTNNSIKKPVVLSKHDSDDIREIVPKELGNKRVLKEDKKPDLKVAEFKSIISTGVSAKTGSKSAVGKTLEESNYSAASNLKHPVISSKEVFKGDLAVDKNIIHPLKGEEIIIKYRIKNTARVVIIVYDRKGKVVKNISTENRTPGVYSEVWKGDDNAGSNVDSGIYIIFVKTDVVEKKIKIGVVK